MATKKIKINFKMPTPTAAERLHAQQQKNRKAAGLPDPSEYKKKLDSMKSEEVEPLDEISSQLKASYVAGAKKQIKQSEPYTKKGEEYRDIAKNFIAKRQKGIAKASKVEEQLEKKGRFVSGPVKQPFKSNTVVTSVKEAANPAQQAAIAVNMKKHGIKPKNEEVEQMDEKKNLPGLWANIHARREKGLPRKKPGQKGYPKTLNIESAQDPTEGEMKGKQQGTSRKAQIVMNAAKGKKSDNPDKFQKDPELSSEIHKT